MTDYLAAADRGVPADEMDEFSISLSLYME